MADYYQRHRETQKKKSKEYYSLNRDEVLKKGAQRVVCEKCGVEVRKSGLTRHKETKACSGSGEEKDYSKSKIYRVVSSVDDEIYIGSTTLTLSYRMGLHRYSSKVQVSKFYTKMRESGAKLFQIELIENYPCCSKKELLCREQYWIDKLNPILNHNEAIGIKDYKLYKDEIARNQVIESMGENEATEPPSKKVELNSQMLKLNSQILELSSQMIKLYSQIAELNGQILDK